MLSCSERWNTTAAVAAGINTLLKDSYHIGILKDMKCVLVESVSKLALLFAFCYSCCEAFVGFFILKTCSSRANAGQFYSLQFDMYGHLYKCVYIGIYGCNAMILTDQSWFRFWWFWCRFGKVKQEDPRKYMFTGWMCWQDFGKNWVPVKVGEWFSCLIILGLGVKYDEVLT